MKILTPVAIALLGLGVGVGAGVALKPAPEKAEDGVCAEGEACEAAAADPLAPPAAGKGAGKAEPAAVVALGKPFVVPVFRDEKVVAMVVASVAVAVIPEKETLVDGVQPLLRDHMLAAMFRHANSGGFDGAFTTGQKMADLRAALLVAAREVLDKGAVSDVLITEIARQDV